MAITLTCPRCKRQLSVSGAQAGSYTSCSHCQGRVWVPENKQKSPVKATPPAAAVPTPVVPAQTAAPPPQPPAAPPRQAPAGTPPGAAPTPGRPSATPPDPLAPPPSPPGASQPVPTPPSPRWDKGPVPTAPGPMPPTPPTPPGRAAPPAQVPLPPGSTTPTSPVPAATVPGRKVARFISAEAAQSKLEVAADGHLPELQLAEGDKKKAKDEQTTSSVNPLVLFGAISMSVVLSIILVLYDTDPKGGSAGEKKDWIREQIRETYFADAEHLQDPRNAPPLKPYQRLLREAERSHDRGDYEAERENYRRVLQMLRAERGATGNGPGGLVLDTQFEGLTGAPSDDRQLEQWISILLSDG